MKPVAINAAVGKRQQSQNQMVRIAARAIRKQARSDPIQTHKARNVVAVTPICAARLGLPKRVRAPMWLSSALIGIPSSSFRRCSYSSRNGRLALRATAFGDDGSSGALVRHAGLFAVAGCDCRCDENER
jgi:hypothetical protein